MKTIFLAAVSILSFSPDIALAEDAMGLEVHAFLSQGFIKTTDNDFLAKSHLGSFAFTEAGINFTKELGERMRTGLQIFARQIGHTGGFGAKLDWFYFDYHASDRIGLRFGRVKLPFGLYNANSDVDSGRTPILLPQSIYPTLNRDFLLAQNGFELYGRTASGSAGALDYRAYAGTISFDLDNVPGAAVQVKEIDVPYVTGGRVVWETPAEGLRAGATIQALRLDADLFYNGTTNVTGQVPALLWIGSLEYTVSDLLLAAEYSRWNVKAGNTSDPTLFPASSVTSERAYVMGAYRMNDWLQPALYYSLLYPNVEKRTGRQNQQHDIAAALRFDINDHWLVKVEGHYMRGTASLNSALNGGSPLSSLTDTWGAFLLKTTTYF